MPLKCDLRLIDEHFESEFVDVSTILSSDVKTVKTIDHKGAFSIEEPKPVWKNSFGPPIIEDGVQMIKLRKKYHPQGQSLKKRDFNVQAMMDADYELAARLRAEQQRRKPLTKA
nr:hypothetical protein [Tanacetum cinerariifolium]